MINCREILSVISIKSLYIDLKMKKTFFILSTLILIPTYVFADQPRDWQLGFQDAASQSMYEIVSFHNSILLPIIIAISVFVLFLMAYACFRFRESRNPNPSKTTHNVAIEVLWTLIPCLILIVMAVPSFKILYSQDTIPKADVTIKAIGYQWYWGYEYPDHGNFAYEAFMLQSADELEEDKPFKRMLTTDTKVVVPVDKIIRVQVTAADVLHSWAVPAFGVKTDAVPGRLNETWFKADKTGIYYGMCSELCGVNHQSMPIEIHVVTEDEFTAWVKESKEKYAINNDRIKNIELVANK